MEKKDIDNLAALARIDVPEGKTDGLLKDMEAILEYVSQVGAVAGASGDGVSEATAHRNVFREDREPHEGGKYTDVLLNEAPATEGGYVKVKNIL